MGYADKFSWRGVPPSFGATVKLDVYDGNVIGVIQTLDFHYTIEPLGGGLHALIEIDHTKFKADGEPVVLSDGPMQPERDRGGKGKTGMYTVLSNPEIDILVFYTTNAKNAAYDIEASIASALGLANDSFSSSLISASLNLVAMVEVSYTESDSLAEDLTRLMLPNDWHMDNIHTYRNFFGADVVMLIVDSADNLCGRAYWNVPYSSFAMGVVQHDCIAGYTITHEIGHIIGAGHEKVETSNPFFSYGHGYVYSTGNWRTVMATNGNPEPRINYWSNPDKYLSGIPMGTSSDEDNARIWDLRAADVADFEDPVTPPGAPSVTIDGPTLMMEYDTERFDADVTGGGTPLSYQWYYKHDTDLYWTPVGFNASYYNHTAGSPDAEWLKVEVTDVIWRTASDDIFINVLGLGKRVANVEDEHSPKGFILEQNYPNPFNPSTTIVFSVPEASEVSLDVYDVMGRHVSNLFQGVKHAGRHEVAFDAASLSSGVYITRIKATGTTGLRFTKDMKMNLVK